MTAQSTASEEGNAVTETVKDVFEDLLNRWHEERELAILTSPADKGVKALRLDLMEHDYEEYRKRFEAALGEQVEEAIAWLN